MGETPETEVVGGQMDGMRVRVAGSALYNAGWFTDEFPCVEQYDLVVHEDGQRRFVFRDYLWCSERV